MHSRGGGLIDWLEVFGFILDAISIAAVRLIAFLMVSEPSSCPGLTYRVIMTTFIIVYQSAT